MSVTIENRKVLITGATGGIGNALFHRIASEPSNILCISGTNAGKLDEMASIYENTKVHKLVCNLESIEEAESLPDKANQLMLGLDGVVCNAGITLDGLAIRMKILDWEKVIRINLTANFLINRAACKIMIRNKSTSSIVNITSIIGLTGNAGQANYAAAKAGLACMSKSLALEYANKGIRINCVAPGFVDTKMTEKLSQEAKDSIVQRIPMKRIASPEEIAGSIIWLLGEESSYVTGQTISVNGGLFMQ